MKQIVLTECTKTAIFQLLWPLDTLKLVQRELIQYCIIQCIYFKAEAITLAIIWLEIVKKRYTELCDNVYRSSLLYKADSVNIIFQGLVPVNFLIKEFLHFDILS